MEDVNIMTYILRPYQQKAVDAAKRYLTDKHQKKPVLMVLPTGSGKSLVIAEIAQVVDAPLIVFQPTKEILEQNYNKMMEYGIFGVTIYSASCRSKEIGNITLATIGSVFRKPEDFKMFRYIIIDECFVKGTLIDGLPIEKIKKNDVVRCFNHNTREVEFKRVKATSKRKIQSPLVKITLEDGVSFVCTWNHPIYTMDYGYISAYSLSLCVNKPLLYRVIEDEPQKDLALYGMRKGVSSEKPQSEENLLQPRVHKQSEGRKKDDSSHELCNMREGDYFQGQSTIKQLVSKWKTLLFGRMLGHCGNEWTQEYYSHKGRKTSILPENEGKQSNVDGRDKRENDSITQGKNLSCSWRERTTNKTTTRTKRSNEPSNGVCHRNGKSYGFVSKFAALLQSGFSRTISKIGYRSRREDTPIKEMEISRSAQNRSFNLVRLASAEVYQQGSGREFKSMCGDGYVYNLEIEDNHNYFVNNYLVHNCHLCNAKGGMYKTFFDTVGSKLIGLTATPYRLSHDGFGGSILKFLTRTNPRVFSKVIHVTQTKELSQKGYFSKTEYFPINGFNRSEIKLNSTGADYREDSERTYYDKTEFKGKILKVVKRLLEIGKTRILVFTKFVEESRELAEQLGDCAAMVNGEMKAKERDKIIKGFRSGEIKVVCNVGVLTVGFDYPELEVVVIARPTRSLTLYYQMLGRSVRPHPDKEKAMIVDMCGNYDIFGRVEDMQLMEFNDNIWYVISKGRKLTNVYLGEIMKN